MCSMGVMQTEGLDVEVWILSSHIKQKSQSAVYKKKGYISYFDLFLQY